MSWNLPYIHLSNSEYFDTLNGLWTGKKEPFVNAGVIRNTNFTKSGKINFSDVAWLDVEDRQLSKKKLLPGDIIVERSGGGPKQPVGRVVIFEKKDGIFSFSNFTSTIRIKNKNIFNSYFIFYCLLELYLCGQTEDLQRRTTGIRNLDFNAYKERAIFPLISLNEQINIASILKFIQQAIEKQTLIITLTYELKKSLLQRIFTEGMRDEPQLITDIGLVPNSWHITKLGSETSFQTGGTPSRENLNYWVKGTIPWVKTTEVKYNIIEETEEKITIEGLENSSAKIFPKGTLIVAMYGQGITRGRVAILGIDAATNQACAAITSKNEKNLDNWFIFYYLQYHYENLRKMGHGANQKNMNMALLKGFPLAYPQISDQIQIINILKTIDIKISLLIKKKKSLDNLFRTLLHQLMTAQIRVNDLDLTELELILSEESA